MKYQNFKKQLGFTLVEVGIVVAVVLLLLSGVVGAQRIIAGTKVNDEVGELKTVATSIQKIYSSDPNFAAATLTQIIALKGLPVARVASATTAANRWGGAITIVPATINTANDAMVMTTNAVPEYECVNIVPQAEGAFARIAVAGTDVKPAGGVLNKTTLGTQCAGGNVAIAYYFTK